MRTPTQLDSIVRPLSRASRRLAMFVVTGLLGACAGNGSGLDSSEAPALLRVKAGEADWAIARGHNLKLTAEFFDPDRRVPQAAQTRWSLLYELAPLPFLQLRAGWRRYDGIPRSDFQNRRLLFIELHAFL